MREVHHKTIYETEMNHWWYRVRRKMVHDLIRQYYGNSRSLRILDLGCGTGALLKELNVYGKTSGTDTSEQAVAFCKSRGIDDVALGNATALSTGDNTFDLVLMLDVLEHIKDDRQVLREIYRVLKPGGQAIVFVPAFMFLWGITDVLSEHFRRYTIKELKNKARDAGFSIVKSTYFNFFLFLPIAALRLTLRLFKIPIESENTLGTPFINRILYTVFRFESKLIRYVRFPFGVSALAVIRK